MKGRPAGTSGARGCKRGSCQVEGTGGLAAEQGQGIQGFGALAAEVGQIVAGLGQIASGLRGVNFRDGSGLVTGLQNVGGLLAQLHVGGADRRFGRQGSGEGNN